MQQLTKDTLLHGGTYKIVKMLGQGSFGITYLAEHTSLGKKVAIKEFFMKELNSRSDDGSITGLSDGSLPYNYAQKFRKEAQNLARLEHSNIVRVTDCFDENGTFYYVIVCHGDWSMASPPTCQEVIDVTSTRPLSKDFDVKRFGLNTTSRIKAFVFRFVSIPAKRIITSNANAIIHSSFFIYPIILGQR